jgi:hypothetical protein
MSQPGTKFQVIIVIFIFIAYFIIAARPIPRETVLAHRWLSSLEFEFSDEFRALMAQSQTNNPETPASVSVKRESQQFEQLVPFTLGSRFGYIDPSGKVAINKIKTGDIYLSKNRWTEYGAEPSEIDINNVFTDEVINIKDPRGYPILLDNRIFILGSEQNSISEIDNDGNVNWTYDFSAPLTCIDAAAGFIVTGSIDGVVEVLDSYGSRIFIFEPGGSRYAVILGCAISRNGSRIGIVSGVDQQRFLILERFGSSEDYKVVYHEFLGEGFRRPVRVSFIDQDRRLIFERQDGIGCYNTKSRQAIKIPLAGEIAAIDDSGDQGFFFLINSRPDSKKELIGIKFPADNWLTISRYNRDMWNTIFMKAAFKSDDVFLGRNGSMLLAGGGTTLISFELEEK